MTESIIKKKYLSVLVDRFFSRYQQEEQPLFVEFVKKWFEYAEESYVDTNGITKYSFWKIFSELDNYIDVDLVPNEVLYYFMQHYANNLSNVIEDIPFFVEYETDALGVSSKVRDEYGNIIYRYDNIRVFLKVSKKFFSSKGSYYSLMFLFKLFGGSLEIIPLYKDIFMLSDKNHLMSAPNTKTNRLSHWHGIDPDPYKIDNRTYKIKNGKYVPIRDWWYTFYSYKIKTNLSEEIYKPIILELVNPSGMKCVWQEVEDNSDSVGWGFDDWGNPEQDNTWGSVLNIQSPRINVSTNDIVFTDTSVGLSSTYREIQITNLGEESLIISSISVGDEYSFTLDLENSDSGYDPIGNTFPATIEYGVTKTFRIKFNPIIVGLLDTTVVIYSNSDINSVKNIKLSGYAV